MLCLALLLNCTVDPCVYLLCVCVRICVQWERCGISDGVVSLVLTAIQSLLDVESLSAGLFVPPATNAVTDNSAVVGAAAAVSVDPPPQSNPQLITLKLGPVPLKKLKEALPEEVSYSAIKFVQSHNKRLAGVTQYN